MGSGKKPQMLRKRERRLMAIGGRKLWLGGGGRGHAVTIIPRSQGLKSIVKKQFDPNTRRKDQQELPGGSFMGLIGVGGGEKRVSSGSPNGTPNWEKKKTGGQTKSDGHPGHRPGVFVQKKRDLKGNSLVGDQGRHESGSQGKKEERGDPEGVPKPQSMYRPRVMGNLQLQRGDDAKDGKGTAHFLALWARSWVGRGSRRGTGVAMSRDGTTRHAVHPSCLGEGPPRRVAKVPPLGLSKGGTKQRSRQTVVGKKRAGCWCEGEGGDRRERTNQSWIPEKWKREKRKRD